MSKTIRKNAELQKIVKLRNKKDFTQEGLSIEMNYSSSYVKKIEKGQRELTSGYLDMFKKALDLENVPILDDEVKRFEADLLEWFKSYFVGNRKEAIERNPYFAKGAEWCLEPHIQLMYDVYSLIYYISVFDYVSLRQQVAKLEDASDRFTEEYRAMYHIGMGYSNLIDCYYERALKELLKVESITTRPKFIDEFLYHIIALCLTSIGIPIVAMDYIAKAQHEAVTNYNTRNNMSYQNILAINYKYIGKIEQSLSLLEELLRDAEGKLDSTGLKGSVYQNIASTHQEANAINEAVENFNKSLDCFARGSAAHTFTLYLKAVALADFGKIDECKECIDEGLKACPDDETLCGCLLNALKHSLQLKSPESVKYLEKIAIPRIKTFGLYRESLKYYEKLSNYFATVRSRKLALTYLKQAYIIKNKITKGVIDL